MLSNLLISIIILIAILIIINMKKEKFVISGEIIDKNIKELTLGKGTKIDIMTKKEMIFPNIFKLLNDFVKNSNLFDFYSFITNN